jgi:hypothetical protein
MKKGAVPVPYIIALLLGIAVVAVLGYWFFILGGQVGGEITLSKCEAYANNYCNSWKLVGYGQTEDEEPTIDWFVNRYPNCAIYAETLRFNEDPADATFSKERSACVTLVGEA